MLRSGRLVIGCAAILITTTILGGNAGAAVNSSSPSPPQLVTITIPAPAGEIPSQWLNYSGPPRADVLLPAGYNPDTRYPLLVLLNGLDGNYDFYAQYGLINEFDNLDAIVVMPDGGPGGWFADWWNDGERGSPAWETYELDTVIPTIMSRYPILPQRHVPGRSSAWLLRVGGVAFGLRGPPARRSGSPTGDGLRIERFSKWRRRFRSHLRPAGGLLRRRPQPDPFDHELEADPRVREHRHRYPQQRQLGFAGPGKRLCRGVREWDLGGGDYLPDERALPPSAHRRRRGRHLSGPLRRSRHSGLHQRDQCHAPMGSLQTSDHRPKRLDE